jgi:hypothetical protein
VSEWRLEMGDLKGKSWERSVIMEGGSCSGNRSTKYWLEISAGRAQREDVKPVRDPMRLGFTARSDKQEESI